MSTSQTIGNLFPTITGPSPRYSKLNSTSATVSFLDKCFFISSAAHHKNTTNEWYRNHGYHQPFDVWLLLQWITYLVLAFGYLFFSTRLVDQQDLTTKNDTEYVTGRWNAAALFFLASSAVASIKCSLTETGDSKFKTEKVKRDMLYIRTKGVPVVVDGWCNICRVYVDQRTRHCKLCNKCIAKFDHHCRWLNCCIAESNYRSFIVFIVSAFIASLISSLRAISALAVCFSKGGVEEYASRLYRIFPSTTSHVLAIGLFINLTLVALSLGITIFIGRLILFHFRLYLNDMSTIEYLAYQQQRKYYNHYEDEDDENPWRRPYYTNPWRRRLMRVVRAFLLLGRFCTDRKILGRDSGSV